MKHYLRGIVIILLIFSAMVVLVSDATQRARAILEKIEAEGGTIDIITITDAANRTASEYGGAVPTAALLFIFVCWCFAVIDAYYIGKRLDSQK